MADFIEAYPGNEEPFVGVSTDGQRTVANVKPFVRKMGDKMDYIVAIDKDGATAKAYRDAHYVQGVPHAFVIDQKGRVVWVGDPMKGLEEVIEKVVSGKFDLEAAKKKMAPVYEKRRRAWMNEQYITEYFRLVQSSSGEKEAAEFGQKLLDIGKDNAELVNRLSWDILTKYGIVSRDRKLALNAARRDAVDRSEFITYSKDGRGPKWLTYCGKWQRTASRRECHVPTDNSDCPRSTTTYVL